MYLQEHILEATRDILRTDLKNVKVANRSIRILNDERVPAYSGEEFIGLYNAEHRNEYSPKAIVTCDVYTLTIGITRRLIGIPTDTSAETIYAEDERLISRTKSNMLKRAREIVDIIDGNWSIVNTVRINALIDDINVCILSPLGLESMGALEEVEAAHFHADEDSDRPEGLLLELQFVGMESYVNKLERGI